jgi:hypothetical protein
LRQIGVIGLLTLLLYNMFGLAVSVLLMNDHYPVAVTDIAFSANTTVKFAYPLLPYSNGHENAGEFNEIFRIQDEFYNIDHLSHQNDTLYITLKSNQTARDEFFELAGLMEALTQSESTPPGDMQNTLRMLENLHMIYLPSQFTHALLASVTVTTSVGQVYALLAPNYTSLFALLGTPPPEAV